MLKNYKFIGNKKNLTVSINIDHFKRYLDISSTLIWAAKFSAKTVSMPKVLQNNSNLNDFEYSRHLKARKIEKRPKKFWRPNKGQNWKNPNFCNFFDFFTLIGSKNSHGANFFHFRSHKGQKGHYKAKS